MTMQALTPQPRSYSGWQKFAMSLACLCLPFLALPLLNLALYLFQQESFLGLVFGFVLAVLAVAIALWPLFMLFRIWAERWPFLSRGETLF